MPSKLSVRRPPQSIRFVLNQRWRLPPSCFESEIKFGASDLFYTIFCTPSFKFGENRLNGTKVKSIFSKNQSPSYFWSEVNFGASVLFDFIFCTPSFKFGENRLNGSKVTAFFLKTKMAAATILFLVGDKFWGQPPIPYPFLHTQFQIW